MRDRSRNHRYRKEPYIVKHNGRPVGEDAFIEEYTKERIAEFLIQDTVTSGTRERIRRLLR